MQFTITDTVIAKIPSLLVGIIACRGISNIPSPPEVIALLREAENGVRASIADVDALKLHPNIAALQEVHRSFGSNPNKFPPSSFALAKRVLKGGQLPAINTLVDLYNVISLKYLLPAGGEDLDLSVGDIELTVAKGGEPFTPLGETENDPALPGEIIYRDDVGVICRKLDWREGVRTCLTEKTTNAVLVIEAVPPTDRTTLQAALDELCVMVLKFAQGTAMVHILDGDNRTAMM